MLNDTKADFLCELGIEELPSGSVNLLGESLQQNISNGLLAAKINYDHIHYFASPRRLAVLVTGVVVAQEPQKIIRKGPSNSSAIDDNGQPLPALLGFARSCGVNVDQLSLSTTPQGSWWIYETATEAVATRSLLPDIITLAINQLPIKKLMRWGVGDFEFVRPVHWLVCLWNKEVIQMNLLGVSSSNNTYGHRFHHPEAILINSPTDYEALLMDACVIADFNKRRQAVMDSVNNLALAHGYSAVMPDDLIDEVTSIVEMPNALLVPFAVQFLDVPEEVLITSMQVHQKCFALYDKDHNLQPYFITVANIKSKNPEHVIKGNAQVMHARLSDAEFFYNQDKKKSLSSYIPETSLVVFQAGLGSLYDQSCRLQKLIQHISAPLSISESLALRVASLSQCDLLTGMVGEFPELQGVMGSYYALNDGESVEVACALREQYYPRFAADILPQSTLGLALSLVTRLDILVGAFLLGKKPSGVKDPFKLRRHALALVRLLIAIPIPLSLNNLLSQSLEIYHNQFPNPGDILSQLKNFIWDRAMSYYQAQGFSSDLVQSVRVIEDDCFLDVDQRIKALVDFQKTSESNDLVAICKRVGNLLNSKLCIIDHGSINPDLFESDIELNLFSIMQNNSVLITKFLHNQQYVNILHVLSQLREPLDNFFTNILVNVDDANIRNNRLQLLIQLQKLLKSVADLSLIQVF